ncbi:hypothetical protein AUP68_17854 [Ilyonectria robusta]
MAPHLLAPTGSVQVEGNSVERFFAPCGNPVRPWPIKSTKSSNKTSTREGSEFNSDDTYICRLSSEDRVEIHSALQGFLGHLHSPAGMATAQPSRPLKYSNRVAKFHNGLGCDIVAMQTRSVAESGGGHLFASVAKIFDHITTTRPDLA